ncbi:GTP-binding protein [Calothrix sp. UHCC 0171]|uniref:GTP-binding protein n=1 Tax=Calothrix sp. UHCC 0171 TaxID=3110245 RepID=UPI002B1FD957|nr:GTP-binding protein [Calothrix sp. UHCC 0171]MEA5573154.1 GTP-binding protein [Calothrix sp. UHCC 0171]
MSVANIIVVAGSSGAGKTTWVCQQIRDIADVDKIIYYNPGTGTVPVDQTRIASEFPDLQVFGDAQQVEFLNQIPKADAVFIEWGFYLELGAVAQLLENLTYRTIAVLPLDLKDSEYHTWAKEIVRGAPIQTNTIENLWRAASNGQVIDENSLEEFWYEITHRAYGIITRAKGIFDVNDGRSLYCDFVAGVPQTDFLELGLPRYLEGRPQRFSGLEVVGQNLDEAALKQTLSDCCLSDAAILQYQQQVKEILLEGEPV